jgi:competence protein ComEA
MFRKLLAGLVALVWSTLLFAAVDANKAGEANLSTIKGIGPAISARIIAERKTGPFKDWPDFIGRVKGVGEATATKFSAEGLTINGASYKAAPAKNAATKDAATKDTAAKPTKDAAAKTAKDPAAKPAAPAKGAGAS